MNETLYRNSSAAYREVVDDFGAEADLIDRLAATKRTWRNPDRDWNYDHDRGNALICASFAALVEDGLAFDVMRSELGDDWPTIAAKTIIQFRDELRRQRRRTG